MLETAWESRWLPDSLGGLAQLGERLPCKQEVTSSNLVVSTRLPDGARPEGRTHLENCIRKKKREREGQTKRKRRLASKKRSEERV